MTAILECGYGSDPVGREEGKFGLGSRSDRRGGALGGRYVHLCMYTVQMGGIRRTEDERRGAVDGPKARGRMMTMRAMR
jgi:hypothetical protein